MKRKENKSGSVPVVKSKLAHQLIILTWSMIYIHVAGETHSLA